MRRNCIVMMTVLLIILRIIYDFADILALKSEYFFSKLSKKQVRSYFLQQ